MSKISKSLRSISSTLYNKFGGNVTYKKIKSGTYDLEEGLVNETISNFEIKGVLQDVNQRETNDLIKEDDKILSIAAEDLEFIPSVSDRVVIVNIEYQIIRISKSENDNQQIKYKIYLRA